MAFVHELQNRLGSRFRSEPHVRDAALTEQSDLVARSCGIGNRLRPEKSSGTSRRNRQCPARFGWRAKIDGKIGVEQRDFFYSVSRHQAGQFTNHSFRRKSVEAPLVEHHVGAVIARVRTTHAGRVSQLPHSAGLVVSVEVHQVESGCGQRLQLLHPALGVVLR